jgi:hypothetical protein
VAQLIDVWDLSTFDDALLSMLKDHAQLIRNYRAESVRLDREREAQSPRGPYKENRFGPALMAFREAMTELMSERTIRAWHFTRLTAGERAIIREAGMQPMTLALIARRLDAAVAAGDLDRDLADQLYAECPFHRQIEGSRENKIWLTAQPYPLDDSGVEELLDRWGGESISFVHRDGAVLDRLQQVGSGCVLEIALPLRVTTRVGEAAQNVIDAFSASIGVDGGWGGGADMVAVRPVEPEWIIAIHCEGDPTFEAIGRGYPASFVADPDQFQPGYTPVQ